MLGALAAAPLPRDLWPHLAGYAADVALASLCAAASASEPDSVDELGELVRVGCDLRAGPAGPIAQMLRHAQQIAAVRAAICGDLATVRRLCGPEPHKQWAALPAEPADAPIELAVLRAACGAGRLVVAQWAWAVRPDTVNAAAALRRACAGGHSDVIAWLLGLGLPGAEAFRVIGEAFCDACAGGHLQAAAFILAKARAENRCRRASNTWSSEYCGECSGCCTPDEGKFATRVATYAVGLPIGEFCDDSARCSPRRGRSDGALALACGGGHLAVAQWLCEALPSYIGDALAYGSMRGPPFIEACKGGHVDAARWLWTYGWYPGRGGAIAQDCRISEADAARGWAAAASRGHSQVTEWLASVAPGAGARSLADARASQHTGEDTYESAGAEDGGTEGFDPASPLAWHLRAPARADTAGSS